MEIRVPPNEDLTEKLAIACVMRDPEVLVDAGWLKPDHFYTAINKVAWKAIKTLEHEGSPIDLKTVSDKMPGIEMPFVRLAEICEVPMELGNFSEYARRVYDLSVRRNMIRCMYRNIERAYDVDSDIKRVVESSSREFIDATRCENDNDFQDMGAIMRDVADYVEKMSMGDYTKVGIKTGFRDVDSLLHGLPKSEVVVLAARPKMGKTAMAINIATNAIIEQKRAVAFFSLEMTNRNLGIRALSSESDIMAKRLFSGNVRKDDWPSITSTMSRLCSGKFFSIDTKCSTISQITSKIRWIVAKENVELVVIDHLSLVESELRGESQNNKIGSITRALKLIAKELDICILLLCQLSRACETRPDKRPILSDLRDSGSIEQDAAVVLFIYRDEYYNRDTDYPNVAELIIAANRNGVGNVVAKLYWDAERTTFRNLATPSEQETSYRIVGGNSD